MTRWKNCFKFIKQFWDLFEPDFKRIMDELLWMVLLAIYRCNSSFIALIPKVNNPIIVDEFRPINLIGCIYKTITKILANHLQMVMDSIISESQFAFVKNRFILDGPMILNDVLDWLRSSKRQCCLFKVDFKEVHDSVSWGFLSLVTERMGFREKWRIWVKGCLVSGRASVLINGSPSQEFNLCKGLWQGDPLSPFLLMMEDLNNIVYMFGDREWFVSRGRTPKWWTQANSFIFCRWCNYIYWWSLKIEYGESVRNSQMI